MSKVFITGPGRSGTTFLIQLLTRLGCDTGFDNTEDAYIDELRAGCEAEPQTTVCHLPHDVIRERFGEAPKFLKAPAWSYYLKFLVINDLIEIEHVAMPIRDLTESAHSRLSVGLDFLIDEAGLNGHNRTERQENVLAMLTGKVLEACYLYRIPLTLMRFPKFVIDEEYCYRKVVEFGGEIKREEHQKAWRELARPEQIQTHFKAACRSIRHPS